MMAESNELHAEAIRQMESPAPELADKLSRYEAGEKDVFQDQAPKLVFPEERKAKHSALSGRIKASRKNGA